MTDQGGRCTRRQLLRAGAAGALALGAGPLLGACGRRGYRGPARHVIFLSLDTARPDHFGCYRESWIDTPAIDALARESILFADHMTPVTTTLASHATLFTGKYPHHHGVPRNGFMVNAENVMWTEILKEAGFTTAGFLGSFALDSRFDFAGGFDLYDETFDILAGDPGVDQNQRRAGAVTQAVIDHLERGVPEHLFLFVHYFDPHQPYNPPAPFAERYAALGGPGREREGHPVLASGENVSPEYLATMMRYAGETAYMDSEVGRLLAYLREKGVLDEAILSVTSDHGEHLGDAPAGRPFDHGWTVYEAETRAMWLLRLPGGAHGGERCRVQTSHIDVLPTLARYLGLPAPGGVDGLALDLPVPREPALPRVLFAEATKPWRDVETDPRWFNLRKPRCARRGPYKYIQTLYSNSEEFYDLSLEPRERTNLLRQPTREQARIAVELRDALRDWSDAARPLPSHYESSQEEETRERLRSLGYL